MAKVGVEVWQRYIIEKLRKKNPHLAFASDESMSVLAGAVVHIPQAGASPLAVKNRSSFPATAVQRGDTVVTYALDVFTTDPTHVSWSEENEISYAKADSVLADHVDTLAELAGDHMLYNWCLGKKTSGVTLVDDALPTANVVRTSGAAVLSYESGQTGNRKKLHYSDVQRMQALMNKQDVPKEGRYLMLESYMYQEFIESLSANQMAAFQQSADLKNGTVGMFAGFNILERSTVLKFTAALAVKVPGEAMAATDHLAGLAWQTASVAKALGDTKPFQDTDSPTYYGDVFSALVKMGGRCRRADWKGVLAIVQDTAA